jgi:hypothetical protein
VTGLPAAALTLHAVRLLGFADTVSIAERFGQKSGDVEAALIDAGARGWAVRSSFGGSGGWSLTEAGKAENQRLLAAELEATGAREALTELHAAFIPLNTEVVAACGTLQLRLLGLEPTDPGSRDAGSQASDASLQQTLLQAATFVSGVEDRLAAALPRFSGYARRLEHALGQAELDPAWYTGTDRDSFHRAWFELHEDFLASLGLQRA